MTAPNLLEPSEQAELCRRGSDTLLASWEEYARGAAGAAAVHRLPGAAAAVFPDEPERAVYNNALLERDLGAADRAGALDAMEAVYVAAGVTRFAAWVHESDEPMRAELERRGYILDITTRAMGMALDDIRVPRPEIPLGPAEWSEYLARRRGLGTALTTAQAYDARARGCRTASLQPTPIAERVYGAVGFRDLGRILEFVPRRETDDE